jgi:alkanesulfonate monooxygenase SsuD/methylene tetrahydromethanopterin reductase-like flavin-dependent oxidoreductase (luciferase family)
VEYWIGGSAPRAIDRAARLGDAWLAGPELGSAAILDQLGTYLDALERHGRSRGTIAIRRDIHVGADDADAERVAGPIVGGGYRGFPPDATVVGGPETVAERLGELAQLGFTDVLLRHLAEEQSEVLASLERLAEVRRLVATA